MAGAAPFLSPHERRGRSRIPCRSHAVVAALAFETGSEHTDDLILEVSTKDVSATGARIIAPCLLRVGQPVLFRMGINSGCAISANARIAYKGPQLEDATKCDWGIEFDVQDVEAFQRYRIFDEMQTPTGYDNDAVAVLVSNRSLELFWWLIRLPPKVRVVYVGTQDEEVLERMRKMAPSRRIEAMS